MKRCLGLAIALLFSHGIVAQDDAPEVMLFGVFHFANPGQDMVSVDQIDVSTPENQRYLAALAERLCTFRPTRILLEFDREREDEVRSRLAAYLGGEAELGVNEIDQIGFRVADACGVSELYGIDEREIGWGAGPLFEHLESSAPELREVVMQELDRLQAAEAQAQRELGLKELLRRTNDPELDRVNKDFYLLTSLAGAGAGFEGADATARWWHRNIRMYANIQRHATAGQRVLVVAGQGHTAILKDLLAIDRRIVAHDVQPYL